MTSGLFALDRHGDRDWAPGMLDFAVNVRGAPPGFVRSAIAATLDDLARYPSSELFDAVTAQIAALHGRDPGEVLLLAGASDGFELLGRLGARRAALLQPSFTEPELVLRAAGVPIVQVPLDPTRPLDAHAAARIPDDADLVVIGNPTNPTSVLHPRTAIEALCRPGRIVVVDEAFADLTVDEVTGMREPESLAGVRLPGLVVIRSVTKTFGLAGLRAGYLLADPALAARLSAGRRAWPMSTPALAALAACCGPEGESYCDEQARLVAVERDAMLARLAEVGWRPVADPRAPYVLFEVANALSVREELRRTGIAVRSCANFVGLTDDHLRLAVRSDDQVTRLVEALRRVPTEVK
ncbi:Rv2231c family pyridoxal phosphate-dependent protein CobC [Gordonia sp. NB41Y]|uniref:Rv2231c family pyridoxal phosphate-dependent protein CobC n=1 Tax=Gordonia sp. NB41Y TaxID=875808 RepID=UPI0006B1DA27|nr:Rv2231c family pyridoxal phosphate-dependent protein CobC [Gordonia sp. NB41Y]KOY49453.1 aminotransferase [Gordonia sp. NB41Y]WLP90318.1 Rv2231c family pyridoxal phosphate-dependent protein CobC [Gordonia sp. NB41Y]